MEAPNFTLRPPGKRVAVAIAHAAFLPERAKTLDRLCSQLDGQGAKFHISRSEKREHASVWAKRLWQYGAKCEEQGAEATVYLNDDVEISPNLIDAVDAMLTVPDISRMVSLHAVHPSARSLADAGQRFLATYHLTGPGYVFQRGQSAAMLHALESAPGAYRTTHNEDELCIFEAHRRREPIWNSLPGLVKHDTGVPSSLGYDNHPGRVCVVPWDAPEFEGHDVTYPGYWQEGGLPLFVPTHWTSEEALTMAEVDYTLGLGPYACWWCGKAKAQIRSEETGARLCLGCVQKHVNGVMGAVIAGQRP